jgi:uncharacterized cupredoxin-like copper-binding protein
MTKYLRISQRALAAFLSLTLIAVAAASLACAGDSEPKATVQVSLKEYSVSPSLTEVEGGKIHFVAKNDGGATHELAVISVDDKGNKHEIAEAEDIGAGKTKEFTAKLKPGKYELACLVAPGEAGSTVDHYQQGMHIAFTVR